jgi:L-phenylalanine/L-methionine N-acetyltransferase
MSSTCLPGARRTPRRIIASSFPSTRAPERLVLRARAASDGEGLLALFNQPRCRYFAQLFDDFAGLAELDAWTAAIGKGSFEVVASLGPQLVGYAGLYPLRGRQSHVGWTSVCVHDDHQGQGIGTALLETVIATADLLAGLRRVQLNVYADNERAISLYRRHGFHIEGRHDGFASRDGELVEALTMARVQPADAAKPDAG